LRILLAAVTALAVAACQRRASVPAAPAAPAAPVALPAPAPVAPPPPVAEAPPPTEPPARDDAALVAEERDPDPRSRTVTIRLIVDGRRKARVFWGRKDLGEAPIDVQRPRDSGPLDLLVTAPGFLPLHTRVFTDRDDKLFLRLFSPAEAPQLLGYAPPESARPPRRTP
jgi:hypothetical protein